jgi:hypothetical protein
MKKVYNDMELQIVLQVVFTPGTEMTDVLEGLRKLGAEASIERDEVRDFDPTYGGPVIYFP